MLNLDPTIEALLQKQIDLQYYPLLFVTISGAHLYGFPSPDSDFDLRGCYLLPLDKVLGLREPRETIMRSYNENGREIDLVMHDAKKFFLMLLKREGSSLEQLMSPLILRTSDAHAEMKSLVGGIVTRYHAVHYLGFSKHMWESFIGDEQPRVKPLLYVYRTLLTGIHLMNSGEVESNLVNLNTIFKLPYIPELIQRKLEGAEKGVLNAVDFAFHESEYQRLTVMLENARDSSTLPENTSARNALSDLLVRLRRSEIDRR